jgi:formate hydrogenlyase transcriptional activator
VDAPTSRSRAARWLAENGPKELELLFRAIIYASCEPILVTDADRNHRDASIAASSLLGLPREEIIGRRLDDFVDPSFQPLVSDRWYELQTRGELQGTLRLVVRGRIHEVGYIAKRNVLPVLHLLVLRDKTTRARFNEPEEGASEEGIPSWVQDFALYLLDVDGQVVAWYSGAERIYGYSKDEAIGKNVSFLYPSEDSIRREQELKRSIREGHFGKECWQVKKDGTLFWANVVTMALKDEPGDVQGFARLVRDFSDRRRKDEELHLSRARHRPYPTVSAIAGIVSGEFDRITEANEAFLEIVGYSRGDLASGHLRWPGLTPPEYAPSDELAHEEELQFGTCTPYEKELIRKDGIRVPVLVVTAALKLSPFRWITFICKLGERTQSIEQEAIGHNLNEVLGSSAAIRRVRNQAEAIASTDATVLILGETGTGKTLLARAIHGISPRRNGPFIVLNCPDIPKGLLEGELFGYDRGAHHGALSQKIGLLEMAYQGTLFLDEVGEMPLDLATKLLRALREKVFERLGGSRMIQTDVRLLAATKLNMTQMIGDKLFRSDFFYQLKVFPIVIPPLRDRPEDVAILARHFIKKYSTEINRTIDKIPAGTLQVLANWNWPGNVWELENFMERSVALSSGPSLTAPLWELRVETAHTATLAEVEREHIVRVFRETGGVISTTAIRLGIPRSTLNALMKRLGISRNDLSG